MSSFTTLMKVERCDVVRLPNRRKCDLMLRKNEECSYKSCGISKNFAIFLFEIGWLISFSWHWLQIGNCLPECMGTMFFLHRTHRC